MASMDYGLMVDGCVKSRCVSTLQPHGLIDLLSHGRVICVERAREWSQQPRYAPPPNLFSNCTSAIGACTLFPIPPATAALLRSTDKQSLPIPCPESEERLIRPDFWTLFHTNLPKWSTLGDVTSLNRAPSR
ncbi:unnamed protein product [Bemisia tabaci]|uniref:Uncharacterized protein n=1 Tax=Bemisia tabaci TaxID=7038 RepID=A0A9P0CDT8_BEMTA|nr:unnamed protein product [Bemisia tabaci]